MPNPLVLSLTAEQQQELEIARDRHPQAYMRERAAALLKVAAGQTARQVALTGLYKAREPDTVYRWIRRYQAQGLAGLQVRAGRGRPAAFSPKVSRPSSA